jgi:putative restriction endonuclease
MIGVIEGTKVGQAFRDRQELHDAGIHRPTQAGIAGRAAEGAESIVLSGGYVDDQDFGEVIVYTGHGGRDQNANKQISDQEFTRQNQALVTSCLEGLPVRVVRGAGHKSPYSPKAGYRYDGLYFVDQYWSETGRDGFRICRFRLVSPDFRTRSPDAQDSEARSGRAARKEVTIQRIVRDTALGRRVKSLHNFECQVCGTALECSGGRYAEAAHIRPLGEPHNGPDREDNILCLCPNHHVMFDSGGLVVEDDMVVWPMKTKLVTHAKHLIDLQQLKYHRSIWR